MHNLFSDDVSTADVTWHRMWWRRDR